MQTTLHPPAPRTNARWRVTFTQDGLTDVVAYASLRDALDDLRDVAGRAPCVSVLRDVETIRCMVDDVAATPSEVLVVADSYRWRDSEDYAVLVPYGFARELRDIAVTGEVLERVLRREHLDPLQRRA